jgi:hypothetical protein
MQAIASGPLGDDSAAGSLARHAVDALAFVLPRLDSATRTEWLVYGAPATEYLPALGAMLVYIMLLAAAGLFDFQRRVP